MAGKSPVFVQSVFSRFIVVKSLKDLPPEPQYGTPVMVSEPLLPGQIHDPQIYAPIESTLSFDELEAEHRAQQCFFCMASVLSNIWTCTEGSRKPASVSCSALPPGSILLTTDSA